MNDKIPQTREAIELVSRLDVTTRQGKSSTKIIMVGQSYFHAGASDKRRSWPVEHWGGACGRGFAILFVDDDQPFDSIELVDFVKRKPGIDIFNGSGKFCEVARAPKMLTKLDSVAGHIYHSPYVGIPVISIFWISIT